MSSKTNNCWSGQRPGVMDSTKSQHHSSLKERDRKAAQSWNPCPRNARSCPSVRYMIGAFLMLGFANVYAMRVNLSMALAVMVADLTVMRGGKEVQVIWFRLLNENKNENSLSLKEYSEQVYSNILLIPWLSGRSLAAARADCRLWLFELAWSRQIFYCYIEKRIQTYDAQQSVKKC